ncbi:Prolyl 4-hydroxylase subunit alpha-1 [Orchesella cincta]|uniref:procollagen-proline 4-dioxygenase n=1 Tax=Orchesella cincta TaxID=48709 RepID=A0A1D2M9Y3_ORCCI|nr:Prolyl 4-hydroxylase subunit alpha-1 [Orchesella cincta]
MHFFRVFYLSLMVFLLLQVKQTLSHAQCGGRYPKPNPRTNYEDSGYPKSGNNWNPIPPEFYEGEDIFDIHGLFNEEDLNIINDEDDHYRNDPETRRNTNDYEHGYRVKIEVENGQITEQDNEVSVRKLETQLDEDSRDDYGSELQEPTSLYDFREDAEERIRPHYALDHRKAAKLALVEEMVYIKLKANSLFNSRDKISSFDDRCYKSLKQYLKEFEHDTKALNGTTGYIRATTVTANPLLTFRMIKRIVLGVTSSLMEICAQDGRNSEIIEAIKSSFSASNLTFPTRLDLNDALLGITRIQFAYGLNASDLCIGKIGDLHTNVTLNIDDSLELANYLMELKAYVLAYQWLTAAARSLNDVPKGDKKLATERVDSAWERLLTLIKLKQRNIVDQALRGKRQELIDEFSSYAGYATCRGEFDISDKEQAALFCFLNTKAHPYWTINPLKVELKKSNPPVWQFHDFLSDDTMAHIKKAAIPKFSRAGVIHDSKLRTEYTDERTSMSTWLSDYDSNNVRDPILFKLNKRMELLTGFAIIKPQSSHALQVVEYGSLGGHYEFHWDATEKPTEWSGTGDRIATLFMFLSDVLAGGYTAFPYLGIAVRPEKGSVILWFPLHLNGKPDFRTMHGGCPVIFGTKLAANKLILHNENFLKYKCSLNPNA